jgi:hypothetical protein
MPTKRNTTEPVKPKKKLPAQPSPEFLEGFAMELAEFVTRYRRKVQGYLWSQCDKITLGDLVKLSEMEKETRKQLDRKGSRELRVIWVSKNNKAA